MRASSEENDCKAGQSVALIGLSVQLLSHFSCSVNRCFVTRTKRNRPGRSPLLINRVVCPTFARPDKIRTDSRIKSEIAWTKTMVKVAIFHPASCNDASEFISTSPWWIFVLTFFTDFSLFFSLLYQKTIDGRSIKLARRVWSGAVVRFTSIYVPTKVEINILKRNNSVST